MSKLSIIAPINFLSYGKIGVYVVSELIKLGHDVSLFPIGRSECSIKHEEYIKQALLNAEFFDKHADCIRLWHQFDLAQFVGKGLHIGFPVFELNSFTNREKHHLISCDDIFVCSKWAENIIDLQISKKPRVVPLGVDREIFYEKQSTRSSTVFINIGKWEKRKGHDILPIIFNQAFTENDDVELWMMVDNPFLRNEEVSPWRNLYRNTPLKHKIRFIPHVETDEQVADIIRQADCGIFPSRAEGWCLGKDSKILTDKGIKKIQNVSNKDIVINHLGNKEKVTKVLSRQFTGKILEVKTVGSPSIKITPEHKVLGIVNKYKCKKTFYKHLDKMVPDFYKIGELKKNDFLIVPRIQNLSNELKRNNIKLIVNEEIMRLFGYYIAEGSSNNSSTIFSFHKNEKKYHVDVINIAKKYFNVNTNIQYYDRNRANVVYYSAFLSKMFKELFGRGARNKHIPFEFMFFDNNLIRELLIGLFRGDGTHKEKSFRLSTTSETLAWQVKFLLIKLGIKAALNSARNRLEYTINITGRDRHKLNFDNIYIEDRKKNDLTIMNDKYLLTPIKSIVEVDYNDLVYNLEVSGEHTYCTSAFAVHNCLPALELLSCGKHLIITDYSAQTEFCTNENSLLVPINELEPAYDGKWFFNQGEWGKINYEQIDYCIEYMRKVHQMKQDRILNPNTKGIETAKRFSWKNTAQTIVNHLF